MSHIQELPGLRLHLKSLQSVKTNLEKKLKRQQDAAAETETLLSQTEAKVAEMVDEIAALDAEVESIQAGNVPSGSNVDPETPQTFA